MNAAGIVLCGGKSTRMGSPKALLPFGVETMLQRVVRLGSIDAVGGHPVRLGDCALDMPIIRLNMSTSRLDTA
jgi:CTP:molybdopterin cytidylyltransferase MocA